VVLAKDWQVQIAVTKNGPLKLIMERYSYNYLRRLERSSSPFWCNFHWSQKRDR